MIIELTGEDNEPVIINITLITYMRNANPLMENAGTEIHFPYSKIRVKEKYEGIWNRIVTSGKVPYVPDGLST